MKINRHGRAKILTQSEIQQIFAQGLTNDRDRALFAVCLFSACRIREAVTLQTSDIYTPNGKVRPELIIRKANTKGKLATRTIPVIEDLRQILTNYYPLSGETYLFPGRSDGHISHDSAARILRIACKQVGIIGVSTHSFRRTALTQMSNAGIPLRVIQEISGHRNLEQLQRYLEVRDDQVLGAAATLSMLSPVGGEVGKCRFDKTITEQANLVGLSKSYFKHIFKLENCSPIITAPKASGIFRMRARAIASCKVR